MAVLAPVYSAATSALSTAFTLKSLPVGSGVCLGLYSMNSMPYTDLQLTIQLSVPSYNSNGGQVSLFLLTSHDGSQWGNAALTTNSISNNSVLNAAQFLTPSMREIVSIPLTSSLLYWSDIIGKYVGTLPSHFTILLVNNAGAIFDPAYTAAIYNTFISFEYV